MLVVKVGIINRRPGLSILVVMTVNFAAEIGPPADKPVCEIIRFGQVVTKCEGGSRARNTPVGIARHVVAGVKNENGELACPNHARPVWRDTARVVRRREDHLLILSVRGNGRITEPSP